MNRKAFARSLLVVCATLSLASRDALCADAGPTPTDASSDYGFSWVDAGLFAGGAAGAFLAHEAGHAVSNLALGNVPHLERVSFAGVVPFFAVAAGISCANHVCFKRDGTLFGAGRGGLFLILMAGFDVQHITDEALLSVDPRLRFEHAPFRTGVLAFNTLTSAAYVIANLGGFEPSQGDVGSAVRDAQAPRALTIGFLLGIAGADVARWAWPDQRWLAWVSRAAKVAFLGMPLAI